MTRRKMAAAVGAGLAGVMTAGYARGSDDRSGEQPSATRVETYAVADLVMFDGDGQAINAEMFVPLVELLQANVANGNWKPTHEANKPAGGFTMTPFFLNCSLIIRATPEVHAQIVQQLRMIRRLPVVQKAQQGA
jgi:hypothetical protein